MAERRWGAPLGNQNAARYREFEGTVRRALHSDNGKRLRACAERLLNLAAEGERWAVEMLRDTLDGKPTTAVSVAVNRAAGDMDDAELVAIIRGSSGVRDSGEEAGESVASGLH